MNINVEIVDEIKIKDFLFHFTTEDQWNLDFQVKPDHAILINGLLRLYGVYDLRSYAEQIGGLCFARMHFFRIF